MALLELLNNDPKFFYYSGQGNFNQKSIAFGNDQPGGGNSQQPFMQFPLPENASPVTLAYYKNVQTGLDYPLRGGNGTNISVTGAAIPEAAKIDKQRIEKFLKTQRGYTFIQKQKALQIANPKMEVGEAAQPFNQQVGALLQGGIEYTRVYNEGQNTLAQVGVMGSGIHYDRHGLVPYNPFQLKYEYVVKNKSVDLNRLLVLYKTKLERNTNINSGALFDLGISPSPLTLFEYQGGPDSVGGIGATTIPRFVDTDFDPGNSNNTKVFAFNYNQLSDALSEAEKGQGGIRQDFRKRFLGNIPSSDYLRDSIIVNYGIDTNTGDAIGLQYPEIIPKDNFNPWSNLNTPDLINFGFEAIEYDGNNTFIQFRAFLNNFSDNHTANYSPINYIGRGETFQVYNGFTRQISFGFLIAAQSRAELLPLYDKLNVFVSQLYPDYGPNSFMRTPVVKMTAGDYLYRQPGFLNSVNLTIEQDYPWELESGIQLPHVIKADCQFTPLHDFLPRRITLDPKKPLASSNSLINSNRRVGFNINKEISETIRRNNEDVQREDEARQLQAAIEEEEKRLQSEADERAAADFVNNLPGFLQQLNNASIR